MQPFNIVAPPVCGRDGSDDPLVSKLDPMFFPGITPELAALVGFVVDADFTRPTVLDVFLDAGFVLVALGDSDPSPLCTYKFLRGNWERLLDAAPLTPAERVEAECVFANRIGRPELTES